jgi:hypothetical protein
VDYDFPTLAAAEEALQHTQFGIGAAKLEVVKIVGRIREDELFTELVNPRTGKPCGSLDDYLKLKNEDLKRVAGMGGRHVLRHLKAYICFVEELDFPEDWFLDMGEHLIVLAEAANTGRDLILRDMNEPSPHGGEYLGRSALREEALAVTQAVQGGEWKVKDTKALVNDRLGKQAKSTGEWYALCSRDLTDPAVERVKIETLTWDHDGQPFARFTCDARWTYDEIRLFASKERVRIEGLGEAFADAHLR